MSNETVKRKHMICGLDLTCDCSLLTQRVNTDYHQTSIYAHDSHIQHLNHICENTVMIMFLLLLVTASRILKFCFICLKLQKLLFSCQERTPGDETEDFKDIFSYSSKMNTVHNISSILSLNLNTIQYQSLNTQSKTHTIAVGNGAFLKELLD